MLVEALKGFNIYDTAKVCLRIMLSSKLLIMSFHNLAGVVLTMTPKIVRPRGPFQKILTLSSLLGVHTSVVPADVDVVSIPYTALRAHL